MAGEAKQTMVEARGLARTFQTRTGPVAAVAGVDFSIATGEIVGFLGPNGAGKSTTQRMLSTLLAPTAGEATVAGRDLRRDAPNVARAALLYLLSRINPFSHVVDGARAAVRGTRPFHRESA